MEVFNKLSTSVLDEFKKTVNKLLYDITFFKRGIENVQEFGVGKPIKHNSIGAISFTEIVELRSNLGQELISEINNNYCNGFSLNNYVRSFNLFINSISDKIGVDWILNDNEQLPKYKFDFLNLNNEKNLFCDPHFFKPLHSKPFESLLHDLLFAVREINQQVNDFTKPLLMDESPLSDIIKNAEVIDINNAAKCLDTPLKNLFKSENKYNEVIKLMIEKGLIIKTVDGLTWHGFKRNAKYEAIAFLDELNSNGLLNKKPKDYLNVDILSGTFLGYTCSDKTTRNKNIFAKARPMYETLLNSI